MRSERYHRIKDDDDDIGTDYIIKAALALMVIAIWTVVCLCMLVPFGGKP